MESLWAPLWYAVSRFIRVPGFINYVPKIDPQTDL